MFLERRQAQPARLGGPGIQEFYANLRESPGTQHRGSFDGTYVQKLIDAGYDDAVHHTEQPVTSATVSLG